MDKPLVSPTPDFNKEESTEPKKEVKIPCDACTLTDLCNIEGCQGSTESRLPLDLLKTGLMIAQQLGYCGKPLTVFSRAELLAIAALTSVYNLKLDSDGNTVGSGLLDSTDRRDRKPREMKPTTAITRFDGEYAWLSNFWASEVVLDGKTYPTVENAYQAAKSPTTEREIYETCTAGQAKRKGSRVRLSPNWERIKIDVMRQLLGQKFAPGKTLTRRLIETYPDKLIEGNHWGDIFWGVCNGRGENQLGKLLMEIRYKRMGMRPEKGSK